MTSMWIIIALMTVAMMLLFLVPLWSVRKAQAAEAVKRSELNSEVFQEHLNQLALDLEEGRLDQQTYQSQKVELEERYLADMEGQSDQISEVEASRGSGLAFISVAILCAGFAVATYYKMGASDDLALAESMQDMQQMTPEEMVAQLEQKLAADPDNFEGQMLLARSYMSIGRADKAITPLRKLAELSVGQEGEASILANLAQALYFQNPGEVTHEVKAMVHKALSLDENEVTALGMAGIFAFEQGNYQEAIKHWQQVLALVDEGPNAEAIRKGIANAERRIAGIAPEQPAAETQVTEQTSVATPADNDSANATALNVAVRVSDGVSNQYAADSVVFVYARHVNGPRMPLAIQRMSLKDFPSQVVLDDSTSMAGMAKLSSAAQVEVVVRLSLTGSAMPSEGDVTVVSSPITLTPNAIAVDMELAL